MGSNIPFIAISLILLYFIFMWATLARIRKAGPNEVLIISGLRRMIRREDGTRFAVGFRMLKGGMTFVWPYIERLDRLSLEVMTVELRSPQIRTPKGSTIEVDAVAQAKIGSNDVSVALAAESLLSMEVDQIQAIVFQAIDGHLRRILGTSTDEALYTDWEALATKVVESAGKDLGKMGITVVSFIIRDVETRG